MSEILNRLPQDEFEIVLFGDATLLHSPIEEWPLCDALIAFFSNGFPMDKAERYVTLRKPILVNDLTKQRLLMDRRSVYSTLQAHGIPVPRHVSVDFEDTTQNIEQFDDYIVVDGTRMDKPFVEKPIDGENHNIHIYYPMSAGGGCKHLFRKIGNRSSEFHPSENEIRTCGSFIYEEFLPTQGTDVKVYTIGPNYAHAEARKSPVLDGKVQRDSRGKEVRYPVILSTLEKEMARKVCLAFEQTVCGFDILRVQNGSSLVCDVNGWSFVKNSTKYYEDCAMLLRRYLHKGLHSPKMKSDRSVSLDYEDLRDHMHTSLSVDEGESGEADEEELRCVLAVIRHGDRTPKQKMKMKIMHPLFLAFYHEHAGSNVHKDIKVKAVKDLAHLLQMAKQILEWQACGNEAFRTFLTTLDQEAAEYIKGIQTIREVLEGWKLCGINRKVQLKPKSWNKEDTACASLVLILKWGGDLTHDGIKQAESLGQRFRHEMYPSGAGGGLLRLHSTYRHDLKIYTSDEGRVQKTAAAFAKGFLELEGDLTPILVSLVLKGKDANSMLDQSGTKSQKTILTVKQRLHDILHRGDDITILKSQSSSKVIRYVAAALDRVEAPMKKMEKVHKMMKLLKEQLEAMTEENVAEEETPHGRETLAVVAARWAKLDRDFFCSKKNTYDLSKIPDIHDCIRYDALHNSHLALHGVAELYENVKVLAHAIVPEEYGMHEHERVDIGTEMCHNLLNKMYDDLIRGLSTYRLHPTLAKDNEIRSAHRCVRTRLYFTSESHLHTLLNVLRFNIGTSNSPITNEACNWLENIPELGYMTHIVIRIFERKQLGINAPNRFRAEIRLSPGSTGDPIALEKMEAMKVEESRICSSPDLTCDELQRHFSEAIHFQEAAQEDKGQEVKAQEVKALEETLAS